MAINQVLSKNENIYIKSNTPCYKKQQRITQQDLIDEKLKNGSKTKL